MKESDWKIFKQIKELAIDRFCVESLEEYKEVINDQTENAHNRYLLLYKLVLNRDKQMSLLFDGHSRSKALVQLIGIRDEGLADETLLRKLSEEFLKATDPRRHR